MKGVETPFKKVLALEGVGYRVEVKGKDLQFLVGFSHPVPFEAPEAQVCTGVCQGCSRKLLDFLESELDDWERRLDAGERPGLGDLSRLIQASHKVRRVLIRNGLIEDADESS